MEKTKEFSGEYRFLSNFYPCSIIYNGYSYTCAEAAFQAEKCADPRDCAEFSDLTASNAKRLGRTVDLREGWEGTKITVMRDLLRNKFLGQPKLLEKLLATGDAWLIEGNCWHDNFWGDCTCDCCADKPGRNVLGQLLMDLRSSMQSNTPLEDMPASFRFMNIDVEPLQLFTKARVLSLMYYNGANGATLDMIREQYNNLFGCELVWRYPILDSVDDGCVIIPVREGFLRLPYDEQFADTCEYYQTKNAGILTCNDIRTLLQELNAYSNDLQAALVEMLAPEGGSLKSMAMTLPDGHMLRAVASYDGGYPSMNIELEGPTVNGSAETLCFAEYNPDRPAGHEVCVCAYTAGSDDPGYYKSYIQCDEDKEDYSNGYQKNSK